MALSSERAPEVSKAAQGHLQIIQAQVNTVILITQKKL